ncbi:caspase family protein [Nitrospira sp. Kam-Ns4a]
MLGCAGGQITAAFPQNPDVPPLAMRLLPLRAALVLPPTVTAATQEIKVGCKLTLGYEAALTLPLGREVERHAPVIFSRAFETVDVVTDKQAAMASGQYDALIELAPPVPRIEQKCDLQNAYFFLLPFAPYQPWLAPFMTGYVSLTAAVTDGRGREVLASGRVEPQGGVFNSAFLVGGPTADEVGLSFETILLNGLTELARFLGTNARLRQYASAVSRPVPAPTAPALPVTPQKPVVASTVNIEEVPRFKVGPREQDVAVVIGVEKYRDLPKAEYAENDARLVKEYLVAMGIPERNIELLVNERATFSSFKKTFQTWLPNHVSPDSRIFIYYSGHGSPDPQTGAPYLVPYDGDPESLPDTGYPLSRLKENLKRLEVAQVTVVLDACFSGMGGERTVMAKGAKPMGLVVDETKTFPPHVAVLAASQPSQVSWAYTEKQHGLFTYHFLKAVKEGKTDLVEIYRVVRPAVEDQSKRDKNARQTPQLTPEPERLRGWSLVH